MDCFVHRLTALTALLLLTGALASACGSDEPSRNSVAVAKCAGPVLKKLNVAQSDVDMRGTENKALGNGRYRVTGSVAGKAGNQTKATYVCEVAADSSDKLRGFKVTKLNVTVDTN